jgi:two-component system, LuxR family, sensor kinase FixL
MPLSSLASRRLSAAMPLLAATLAAAIFVVDTATTLDIAIAVLYVAVILLAMDFAGRRGVLLVAAACGGLTLLSFVIVHEEGESGAVLRCLVSLAAIAIVGLLAARHQRSVASLREHASLLDLTHDTVFVRDRGDVIVYWNRAAEELYGWSSEQALGRKAAELLRTEFPAPFEQVMADLARDGRWEGELVHTCRDGRRVTVASRWALRRDGRGQPATILETNNDVTERRGMEEGLDRARSELAHVGRLATLGELTASIAHEVNQPLAAIVTNGEAGLRWLDREVPNLPQVRTSLEHMIRNGQRASDVVRRLRALSRKVDPVYEPVSVADVINDVALLIDRELLAHRVTLSIQAAPGLHQVRGDRVQLQQVAMNLMLNGLQAMDAVADRPRRLTVEIRRSRPPDEAEGVTFVVSDAGKGIDPAHLPRLFDAFFTTRSEGMGMGLSICRSIVEAHGGRISAVNRDGAGASFYVSLPQWQDGAA